MAASPSQLRLFEKACIKTDNAPITPSINPITLVLLVPSFPVVETVNPRTEMVSAFDVCYWYSKKGKET
jgi:hypothetical protein